MKRSKLPLLAALFLTVPSLAQQNPAPPIYPSPGNPADAQSQQNVSAEENSQMPVFRRQLPPSWWIHYSGFQRHKPDARDYRQG